MKKLKKLSVTIGIPAFNEEANISSLLMSLLSQKSDLYVMDKIIVYSDASTDKSVQKALSLKSSKIIVIAGKKRIGQQQVQNFLLKASRSDVFVLIEADTVPFDHTSIEELVKPFLKNNKKKIGMVVGQAMGTNPNSIVERVTFFGEKLKGDIFSEWNNGNNIYVSGGHAMRAFSREFSTSLSWPTHVPEDSFAYLLLKTKGLSLLKNARAKAWVRNVGTARDSIVQSQKFRSGKKALEEYFGTSFVRNEYNVPVSLIAKHMIKNMFCSPLYTIGYLLIVGLNFITNVKVSTYTSFHKTYSSTKNLEVSV